MLKKIFFLVFVLFVSEIKTLHLNDACLSSPCTFGKLCRSLNFEPWFLCVNEIELNPDARNSYRLFKKLSSKQNINTKINSQIQDVCSDNPCFDGFTCVPDRLDANNFECVPSGSPISNQQPLQPQPQAQFQPQFQAPVQQKSRIIAQTQSLSVDPCLDNPCQDGYTCQIDDPILQTFICVESKLTNFINQQSISYSAPYVVNKIKQVQNACLNNPCQSGYTCQPDAKLINGFICLKKPEPQTQSIKNKQFQNLIGRQQEQKTVSLNFKRNTQNQIDACEDNPCQDGFVCQADDQNSFVCVPNKLPSLQKQHRQISSDPFMLFRTKQAQKVNPCLSNPCLDGFLCKVDTVNRETFVCLKN